MAVTKACAFLLESLGYDVLCWNEGAVFLSQAELYQTGVLLLDMRMPVMDGQGVQAGCADHRAIDNFAIQTQGDMAALIGIGFQGEAFVQRIAHQATEILNAEPSFVVLHEGVEEAVVAGEDGGGEVGRR